MPIQIVRPYVYLSFVKRPHEEKKYSLHVAAQIPAGYEYLGYRAHDVDDMPDQKEYARLFAIEIAKNEDSDGEYCHKTFPHKIVTPENGANDFKYIQVMTVEVSEEDRDYQGKTVVIYDEASDDSPAGGGLG